MELLEAKKLSLRPQSDAPTQTRFLGHAGVKKELAPTKEAGAKVTGYHNGAAHYLATNTGRCSD